MRMLQAVSECQRGLLNLGILSGAHRVRGRTGGDKTLTLLPLGYLSAT